MLPTLRSQALETSRIAQAVYREGASDLLRLLDAERTRLQAEALYIRDPDRIPTIGRIPPNGCGTPSMSRVDPHRIRLPSALGVAQTANRLA